MKNRGLNHLGLATRDIEKTIDFYRDILGFPVVRYDNAKITEGGSMRHVFMDCGNDQLISFLAPENIPGMPKWNTGISHGLGVPRGFYHFAFHAATEEELESRRVDLASKGVTVSPIIDHDWSKSIYFIDPVNDLALEFSTMVRPFNRDDRTLSTRYSAAISTFDYNINAMIQEEADRFRTLADRGLGEPKK